MQPLFLFKILGIPFFSYTTLTITGIVLALVSALYDSRPAMRSRTEVVVIFAWMTLPALVFGRAIHLIYNANYYIERPGDLLRFTDGGLALVGLVCGGGFGLWLWCKRERFSFALVLERAALPLTMIATLAWLGAFMQGSQYGAAVDNNIALELRDTFGVISARWPTQLLAALFSASIGIVLLSYRIQEQRLAARDEGISTAAAPASVRRAGIPGLVAYGLGMIALDSTRGDLSLMFGGVRFTQCLYVVLCLAGLLYVARTYRLT